MNWFTGIVLYVLIWWTALFAVLPFGAQSPVNPDPVSGWRGAPERPSLLLKLIATTILAGVIWVGAWLLIRSPYLSFRHGWLALPDS